MRRLSLTLPLLVACARDIKLGDTASDPTADTGREPGGGPGGGPGDSPPIESSSPEAIQAIASAARWGSGVTATVGDWLVVESDGLPEHATQELYDGLGALAGDCAWEASGTSEILSYELSFEIPLSPEVAAAPVETGLGAIGPAISGAVFFNPWEASRTCYAQEAEVDGPYGLFDDCGGHPSPADRGGQYHYHGAPTCTVAEGDTDGEHSRVIGFLMDGFPIYGPLGEDGVPPRDLDACLGHHGPVPETDEPVYHYHVSDEPPYIAPCYTGTPRSTEG